MTPKSLVMSNEVCAVSPAVSIALLNLQLMYVVQLLNKVGCLCARIFKKWEFLSEDIAEQ
jgi:hypothetical protein